MSMQEIGPRSELIHVGWRHGYHVRILKLLLQGCFAQIIQSLESTLAAEYGAISHLLRIQRVY